MRKRESYSIDENLIDKVNEKRLILDVSKSEAVNRILDFGFTYEHYSPLLEYFEQVRRNNKMSIQELVEQIIK